MMARREKELLKILEEEGIPPSSVQITRLNGGHVRVAWIQRGRSFLVVASWSPRCSHADRNFRADVRRQIKQGETP